MTDNKRSALILKLSRQNLEVHNVDQSIWKIQNVLLKPPCEEIPANALLDITKTNVSPYDLPSINNTLENANQDNTNLGIIPIAEKRPVSNQKNSVFKLLKLTKTNLNLNYVF